MSRPPLRFALFGALLSLGAPGGWLALQTLAGASIADALHAEPHLYAYLLLSTALVFSITGWFLGRQWEALHELNARLERLSGEDALTGLPNVRTFWWELRRAIAASLRADDHNLQLLLIDIDHFKAVNDTYGHLEGDRVLTALSSSLTSTLRHEEGAYRVGGEEFAVIVQASTIDATLAIAERLRLAAEKLRVPVVNADGEDVLLQVTISVGMASFRGQSAEDLYKEADEALYKAKKSGRNRVAWTAVDLLVLAPTS